MQELMEVISWRAHILISFRWIWGHSLWPTILPHHCKAWGDSWCCKVNPSCRSCKYLESINVRDETGSGAWRLGAKAVFSWWQLKTYSLGWIVSGHSRKESALKILRRSSACFNHESGNVSSITTLNIFVWICSRPRRKRVENVKVSLSPHLAPAVGWRRRWLILVVFSSIRAHEWFSWSIVQQLRDWDRERGKKKRGKGIKRLDTERLHC